MTMNSSEIKYLTFEGGGGKCVTYLGALKALEEKKIIPFTEKKRVRFIVPNELDTKIPQNNIFGVSGSSGGALIAFFLGMGLGYKEIESLFFEPYDKYNNQFIRFFDYPKDYLLKTPSQNNQYYRSVNQVKNTHGDIPKYIWKPELKEIIREQETSLDKLLSLAGAKLLNILAADYISEKELLYKIIFGYYGKGIGLPIILGQHLATIPVTNLPKNLNVTSRFFKNLISGRGIFVGLGIRDYLEKKLQKYLLTPINVARFRELFKFNPKPEEITFKHFFTLTGVNLIETGTNITYNQPEYFSKDFTPDFPVTEAIGISMALPLLFKPVMVIDINGYQKLYVDGGMLNNYPIHAFDYYFGTSDLAHVIDSLNVEKNNPINPNVLGFRLTSGASKVIYKNYQDGYKSGDISKYAKNLFDTFMYPSEEGQIRSLEEKEKTIELLTYSLSVSDFNPIETLRKKPIEEAYNKVREQIS